jgi:tripartite-type tricarboxylate transporter receptor subunit TctC
VHRNTPVEIVAKLNKDIGAALADPQIRSRIVELGGEPMPMAPAEFGRLIGEETDKWAKVIRMANIKAD